MMETGDKKRKTISIVRKINAHNQKERFWENFWSYLFFYGIAIGGYIVGAAAQAGIPLKELHLDFVTRSVDTWHPWEKLKAVSLYVSRPSGLVEIEGFGDWLSAVTMILGVMFVISLISWGLSWFWEAGRLRSYMKPIDELALTAEKLSAGNFSEERLMQLEESLDQISTSAARIDLGDKDLSGLENAINNLLQRLEASYREQTRFVDDASHELRTPVAVIQGYAAMLERWGMDDRKTLEEAVHAIREESDHMKTLIDQLLFLARGDMGRQKFDLVRTDLSGLVREIAEEYEMIDTKHHFCVECQNEIFGTVEPAMLKQAIRILVDNAAKYTPDDGKITLRCLKKGPSCRIEVQDEGIGMNAKEIGHIFERFYRGDEVRGKTQGSGLGLSIARWIVEKHGGKIQALSSEGIGTRMTIELSAEG